MDCGTIANLFVRFGSIMDGTRVDEYFGFGVLAFIGVGGMAVLVYTLIKNWNAPAAEQSDASSSIE